MRIQIQLWFSSSFLASFFFIAQVFAFLLPVRMGAQQLDIQHYTSGADVIDIARQGDYLWTVQRMGGLTRMDLTDGTMTHYDHVQSGLLTNAVTCVRVAPNGEVWAGTHLGLARFDGVDWKIYRSNNSPLNPNPLIADIVIDDNNIIWIASGSVLYRFDGDKSWQLFAPGNSPLPSGQMNALKQDEDGVFWISYDFGGGVVRFDGTSAVHYTTANSGLSTNNIDRIWIDPQGNKWFGSSITAVGLSRFDGTFWSTLAPSDTTLASGLVYAMAFPGSGGLWIGSNGGLQFFDGLSWTKYNHQNSPMPGSRVGSLLADSGGELWVGFYHGVSSEVPIAVNEVASLARFTGTSWTFYQVGNSPLPHPWVSKIVFDKTGAPWINTYGGGVIRYDGTDWDWKHLGNTPLPGSFISDAAVDQSGSLWMAVDGYGLTRHQGNQWAVISPANSAFPSYWPTAMALGADSSMWFGTKEGHLVQYDGLNWGIYNPNQTPLPAHPISRLVADTINTVWLSYLSYLFPGVLQFSDGVWTHFTADNSALPSNVIHDMLVDTDNHLWVATQAGLARYNTQEWEIFTTDNSPLPTPAIQRLALSGDGMLWIHTDKGLLSYDRWHTWTPFPDPLAGSDGMDKSLLHMNVAPDGRIWAGTHTGVLVFHPVFPKPEILLSVDQIHFDSTAIGDCITQQYSLWGMGLDEPLLIQAPEGFTLALQPDAVFSDMLMLTPENGAVEQTIFVAFCPTAAKPYQEVILHTSAGADPGLLSVSGTGYSITSVESAWSGGALQIYPNPARSTLTAAFSVTPREHPLLEVSIWTWNGLPVAQHAWPDPQAPLILDVSQLSAGLYLLEVRERNTGRRLTISSLVIMD